MNFNNSSYKIRSPLLKRKRKFKNAPKKIVPCSQQLNSVENSQMKRLQETKAKQKNDEYWDHKNCQMAKRKFKRLSNKYSLIPLLTSEREQTPNLDSPKKEVKRKKD